MDPYNTIALINETNRDRVSKYITKWLREYIDRYPVDGFVIGVSGGIDSAVTSTLCAKTGHPVIVVEMPIHQSQYEVNRSSKHIEWLKETFDNVTSLEIDLTETYDNLMTMLSHESVVTDKFELAMANTRSRLRMTTMYSIAGQKDYIVCGTGNRIEDFGIGFFTKHGDGGVDISPLGDLMKTEVYEIGKALGISKEIMRASPTDGLHTDGRTDEDQIGATYPELEWAMEYVDEYTEDDRFDDKEVFMLNDREKEVLSIYLSLHMKNKHKMGEIPVCSIPAMFL